MTEDKTTNDDVTKTSNARRSRAERAKVEMERRRRNSTSRGRGNTNNDGSKGKSVVGTNNDNSSGQTGGISKSSGGSSYNSSYGNELSRRSNNTASTVSSPSPSALSSSASPRNMNNQQTISIRQDMVTSSNMSNNNNNSRHISTTSRTDMSPTGRMRLAQQHQQQNQQLNTSQYPTNSSTNSNYEPIMQQQQQQQQQRQQPPPPPPSSVTDMSTNSAPTSASPSMSSTNTNNAKSSLESPLPPKVATALGDRTYEKRKNAALEVEALVKQLADGAVSSSTSTTSNTNDNDLDQKQMIYSIIQELSKNFCLSVNPHRRKGGLIGLAATGIGLMSQQLTPQYLEYLIKPVIHCFDDPEARVRYYACESLYNIVKVARGSILPYFNLIFDGLTKLFADVDDTVKNGANLLDRLVKDIVTESDDFSVDEFLPLLQNYIRRTNPYIRQLLVGWITVLDGIPDVSMIDYLPDFLDGLFNMLADSNREIRQAADSALCEFLKEIRSSTVVEFGPIVSILVFQCHSKDRLNRLTAITWLSEFIHHPHSGGDALLPFHAEILDAILSCISDVEIEIRKVSDRTNTDLLTLVRETKETFELRILIDTLMKELSGKDDVPTKIAVLKWVNMLLEKRRHDLNAYTDDMLPFLLQSLSDPSDNVVLLTVQVMSRITLSARPKTTGNKSEGKPNKTDMVLDEIEFELVIKAILSVFASDRRLLETRGSLIIRRLCVLLNAKSVYLAMAEIISSFDDSNKNGDPFTLEFAATMIQTLNLILLTASELHNLRKLLESSFSADPQTSTTSALDYSYKIKSSTYKNMDAQNEGASVFASLFECWCNNPVSTFSLCLLARAYDLAFAVVKKFSELDVTVGFLMQIDKLVHLIESPVFVHIRLQLLDVEAPYHTYLLKSCYGLLMLLPQSEAFQCLNDRLTAVCNLRDNLGVKPAITASPQGIITSEKSSVFKAGLDAVGLLQRFDMVMALHQTAREAIQRQGIKNEKVFVDNNEVTNTNKRINNNKPKSQQGTLGNSGNTVATTMTPNLQKAGIGAVIASGIK